MLLLWIIWMQEFLWECKIAKFDEILYLAELLVLAAAKQACL